MIQKCLLFIFCFALYSAFAQDGVGIGVTSPHASSVLHIQSPTKNKGLIIPKLTTTEVGTIASPASGLLVFDRSKSEFKFYDSITAKWYIVNAVVREAGQAQLSHSGPAIFSGTFTAPDYALNATGNGPIPRGGIIMWSGSIGSIPTGWALCDGSNGTPDLRERFVVGAGSSDNVLVSGTTAYAPGDSGGANTVTLTTNEMPSHNHSVFDPGHSHNDRWLSSFTPGGTVGYGGSIGILGVTYPTTSSNTGISIQDSGAGQSHENRPPYFALAFIMKL